MTSYLWLVIAAGALGVLYGAVQTAALMKADSGNERMREIAAAIQEGASAYLKRQYTTIGIVGVVILVAAYFLIGTWAALGFLIGAVLSGAAGYAGMLISVRANVRTAQAASQSLSKGLDLAFRSGAITGMFVAGGALLGVSGYYAFMTQGLGHSSTSREVIDGLVALGFALSAGTASARDLTVVSWGGNYQDAQREIYFKPFAEKTGKPVLEESWDGGYGVIAAKMETVPANWDVVQVEAEELALGCADGLYEQVDWSALGGEDKFIPSAVNECGVGAIVWTTIGSVVGALTLYWIGALVGVERLRLIAERMPLLDAADVDKSVGWFDRHGEKAVFFGRMVPLVRKIGRAHV